MKLNASILAAFGSKRVAPPCRVESRVRRYGFWLAGCHTYLGSAIIITGIASCTPQPKIVGEPTDFLNNVHGMVRFADQKVNEHAADAAIIVFHPASGESAGTKVWSNVSEGEYSLVTLKDGKQAIGAPEGDYIVTIQRPSDTPVSKFGKAIPSKYADPKTTDLKAHVDEGDNVVDFAELK